MGPLDAEVIDRFLSEVGGRHNRPAQMFLIGGTALILLGSTRPTVDIDYVGSDLDSAEDTH